jgi:O-antigen/teichoic acid export membrane protein
MGIRTVFKQSSNYLWGEAIIVVAGIISFPVLTRILNKNEFGLLSLLSATVSIACALFPLGVIRSIVRFYHYYKRIGQIDVFIGTLFSTLFVSGLVSILAAITIINYLMVDRYISRNFLYLVSIALFLGLFQRLFSFINTIHRMEEEVVAYNILGIAWQYGCMFAGIGAILFYRNLFSFYLGQLIIGIFLVFFIVVTFLRKQKNVFFGPFSKEVFAESFKYGFPLALSAVSLILFNLGDRYVIAYLTDTERVASYSVAYRLCDYAKDLLDSCINLALLPAVFKLWEEGDLDSAGNVLSNIIKLYYMIAFPLICLYILIPKELITVIASSKYLDSATIMPIIMFGVMAGFIFPFTAGLHFKKKTLAIFFTTIFAASFNIGLNFLLIPKYGIRGAAFATLISNIIFMCTLFLISFRLYRITIPFKAISLYAAISILTMVVSFFICSHVWPLSTDFGNLIYKCFVYVSIYSLLLFVFDSKVRQIVFEILNQRELF